MNQTQHKSKDLHDLQDELARRGELVNDDTADTKYVTQLGQALLDAGIRVKAEHKVGDYSFDLKIWQYPILIEVDGKYHNVYQARQRDYIKDRQAQRRGFKVYRFTNDEVERTLPSVVQQIKASVNFVGLQPKEIRIYPLTIMEQISRWLSKIFKIKKVDYWCEDCGLFLGRCDVGLSLGPFCQDCCFKHPEGKK